MTQLVEFPLTAGLDQQTDDRKLPAGTPTRAENASMPTVGAYTKRAGNDRIVASGSAPEAGSVVHPYGDGLVFSDRNTLNGYAVSGDRIASLDYVPEWTARQRPIAHSTGHVVDPDFAYDATRNLYCYAWGEDGAGTSDAKNILVQLVDGATGDVIIPPTSVSGGVANGYNPKVISVGNSFVILWRDGAGGDMKAHRINLSVLPYAMGASTNLENDAYTGTAALYGVFDACPIAGSSNFVIVYQNTGVGANRLKVAVFTEALVGVNNTLVTMGAARNPTAIAVDADAAANNLWVAWGYISATPSSEVETILLAVNTLGVTTSRVTVASVPGGALTTLNLAYRQLTSGTAQIAWSWPDTTLRTVNITTALALTGSRLQFHMFLASRIFLSNGKTYALANMWTQPSYVLGTVPQSSLVLVDLNVDNINVPNLRPVCVVAPRQTADGETRNLSSLSNVQQVGTTWHALGSVNDITSSRLSACDIEFDTDGAWSRRQAAELGGLLYYSGGVPSWFDGVRCGEVSYVYYPYASAAAQNIGGALTPNSTYGYAIVFAQRDNQGNVHRSAPFYTNVTLGNAGADDAAQLTITYVTVTTRQDLANKRGKIATEIYRTNADATPPLYRMVTADVAASSGVTASSTGTMQNDPTADTFTYTDQASDASLNGNQFVYTTGNVLDNVNPPSSRLVEVHRNRVFYAGCPNGKEIWPSRRYVFGEAPGFNETLVLTVDDGGDITAIKSMDDKLIIFKDDRIFYLTGDGPDDTGAGSDWVDPVKIVSTVGCIEPRSVAVTPLGILFQSRLGISLLTRGMEVVPYFSPVDSDLANYPVITYAVLHKTLPEVRFGCQSSDGTAGIELRYDYRRQQWFQAKYWDSATYGAPVQSACISRNVFHWVAASGRPYKENVSTCLDNSSFVPMALDFAPLQTQGTQGYQQVSHVLLNLDKVTDHDLSVSVLVDSNDWAFAENSAWDSFAVGTLTREQLDVHVKQQRGQSVRVRIEDASPTGNGFSTVDTGEGYRLAGVTFEVQPLGVRQKNLAPGAKG